MTIKLEVGKTYQTIDSIQETIVGYLPSQSFPFRAESERTYKENGQYHTQPSEADLVEELTPLSPSPEKALTEVIASGVAQVPYSGIEAIGSIFIEGLKYGRDNWKKGVNDKNYQEQRCEHAIRHLTLWANGDRSEQHLAKVAWFCVTQIELERLERQ